MRDCKVLFSLTFLVFLIVNGVNGDNPYRFFTWKVTYGDIYPLGVKQQCILINGQIPGPQIDAITNDNLIINVYNYLREPFLISWMDGGQWTPASRARYNLRDTAARCTTQVYPKSWTAIFMALDDVGMWNLRSENWARQYLGQQFYLRVYTSSSSYRDEYPIPRNALLCGRARGRHTRPL